MTTETKRISIETLEISGIISTLRALRLPHGKDCRSVTQFNYELEASSPLTWKSITGAVISVLDLQLLSRLVLSGDEHAKAIRGITVGVEITAPIWFYRELETYRIGRERLSSESTMHIECKGLSGEELEEKKNEIPMGHIQKTVDTISYQTLRRIYFQRRNHRLPMWHDFCNWIESLPLAKELIICQK